MNLWRRANLYLYAKSFRSVRKMLHGKSVAIIGNAQSLFNYEFGKEIDSHDIVIRMNLGYKITRAESQGTKTTILTVAGIDKLKAVLDDCPDCHVLGLISDRAVKYNKPKHPYNRFFIYPERIRAKLQKEFAGLRPTSGAQMIYFALLSGASKIDLYGFDFFKTFNFYEHRTHAVPHDFDREENWCKNLADEKLLIIHGNDSKSKKRVIAKKGTI